MEDEEQIMEDEIDQIIELKEGEENGHPHSDDSDEEIMADSQNFNNNNTNSAASTSGENFEDERQEDQQQQQQVAKKDEAVLTFKRHTGEIFALDIGPASCSAVCTGGEDDKAFVWDMTNGDVIFECTGHKDSVVCVKYNAKKTLLATADMSGCILVWDTTTNNQYKLDQSFDTGCDLEWLLWHHTADILFAGGADSAVWMWLVPSANCKIYSGHGPNCTAACLLPDGKHMCAGYADGTVKIWDLKENASIAVNGATCHTDSITCITCSPDNNLGASGSVDGTVNLFHCSNGKLIDTIVCAKKPTTEQQQGVKGQGEDPMEDMTNISVETVAFSESSYLLACGTVLGDLVLWDVAARQIRQSFKHPDGLVKCLWKEAFVFTACLDGILRAWDSKSGTMLEEWSGHSKEIYDFRFDEEFQYVITTSSDETAKVFVLNKSKMHEL